MKKIYVTLIVLSMIGCSQANNQYGQGGKNAIQYIREFSPELKENIVSIDVTKEDSLLTDRTLAFGQVQFVKAGADYWQDLISRKQYQHIIDSTTQAIQDVQNSWQYGNVVNDSLRTLSKYKYNWAKVYTITFRMKSGYEESVRVLMDKDGITPRMTEIDFDDKLQQYTDQVIKAQRDIYKK